MMEDQLTATERTILLQEARKVLESSVRNQPLPPLNLDEFPAALRKNGVCFVTLTIDGKLRGCIGALEAYQPLVADVRERAISAAFDDYRFSQVQPEEIPKIQIEISRLTEPQALVYEDADDLLDQLRPNIDGVVLKVGRRRSTFLPQVWKKIADKEEFLNHLCQKMGAPPNLWRSQKLKVLVYQVEEFHE
jgi:AmmeMemoRadiSam system protein A